MKRNPTTVIIKELKLTPDLIDIVENRLKFSLQPRTESTWKLFDLKINFDAQFGSIRLKIEAPVFALRRLLSDTYSEVGELENKELKRLLRNERFQLKRQLYYSLLGKHGNMTEVEANITEELSKDKQIQRYLILRKGGKNVKTKR